MALLLDATVAQALTGLCAPEDPRDDTVRRNRGYVWVTSKIWV